MPKTRAKQTHRESHRFPPEPCMQAGTCPGTRCPIALGARSPEPQGWARQRGEDEHRALCSGAGTEAAAPPALPGRRLLHCSGCQGSLRTTL